MNYTLDANVNFYEELMKDDHVSSGENNCLITDKPLTDNYITLNCNHTFNYNAIYKEAVNQKTKYNPNETTKLKMNELKCPYCRQVTPNILPYVPSITSVCKIIGVTIPVKYSLPHKKCSWIFKCGKNKGSVCGTHGFTSENGEYCIKHWHSMSKTKSIDSIEWTDKMQELYNTHNMIQLRELLRDINMKVSGNKRELVIRLLSNK
tara:strand:+ start:349 stop:966 length:618 start_codon:yes stop_codon:yes gene_type:complete